MNLARVFLSAVGFIALVLAAEVSIDALDTVQAALGAPASAQTKDAGNYYQITIPAGWHKTEGAAGPEKLLASYRNQRRGQVLALTRIAYPNPRRQKSAFHNSVEAGLRAAARNYRRLRRRNTRIERVPVMDVVFQRGARNHREVVFTRFIFFRTFTLVLSVSGPAARYKRDKKRTWALVKSFRPYFKPADH